MLSRMIDVDKNMPKNEEYFKKLSKLDQDEL